MNRVIYCLLNVFCLVLVSCGESEDNEVNKTTSKNLDSLLLKSPNDINLLVKRGNKLFKAYEYDLALNDAAKAFRIDSTNFDARLLYAEVLNNRETRTVAEIQIAQNHYKWVINKDSKNLRALVGLAATYNFQQDFENTFKYINTALRIDPKYRDAYVLKGTTYRQIGNMPLAKSSYETAIQQDPKFFEAYFLLGAIYQAEENPVCIEYFATALQLKPEILEVKYQLAYSKERFGNLESAKELYREMAHDTVDFYVSRGLFHQGYIKQFVDKNKDIDSAMYFYKSALETEPRYVEAWHNIGLCHSQKGNKERALKSFSNALKYDPEFELSRQAAEQIR
ncbi:MAG: tetratricopeptide repeat protein [Crocinitomicaceae bacterium]